MPLPLAVTDLATKLIAGYAALVATVSIGWQIWTGYQARRPQVTVLLDTWRTSQARGRRSLENANIRIRNREEYAVRVERLYFRYPPLNYPFARPTPAAIDSGDANGLPFDVPARDVASFTVRPMGDFRFPRPDASGREFTPLVTIELRTGERYTSRLAQPRP